MTPFECYQLYLSVKRHFTSDYNAFQYNFKVTASYDSFEKRRDRFFFSKLAKHIDPLGKTVANMVEDPKIWIRDLAYTEQAETRYLDWAKKVQALRYNFKNEISKLDTNFNDMLVTAPWETHPQLLTWYMDGTVSLESLSILLMITKAINRWDKDLANDPLWEEISKKVRNYYPFLKIDEEAFKKIIIDVFTYQRAA